MSDDFKLNSELIVHGKRWHTLHDGYFADLKVALPFLNIVSHEISKYRPSVVVDLGGGTGFILSELAKRCSIPSIKYINVDISNEQLRECKYINIDLLPISATEIKRHLLVDDNGFLMFIIRSLLHYFGPDGVTPLLKHLRDQMKPGEIMIHQTACFESCEEADCANDLYTLMRTTKWYPTINRLIQILKETGWQVVDCITAPNLSLKSAELAERYDLNKEDIVHINKEMSKKYSNQMVFNSEESGFTAFLHYRILTCMAVNED